jgi:hypothetical protein
LKSPTIEESLKKGKGRAVRISHITKNELKILLEVVEKWLPDK